MKLHLETVSSEMMQVLTRLMSIKELDSFRLVGGTALALQFGHRVSVDIDLFAGGRVDTSGLPKIISQHFEKFELVSQNQNGIMGIINNIKVDVVDWKVPFTQEPLLVDGIRIATPSDIFASKCEAILDRKSEKDFVDIALIAERFDLIDLFQTLKTRYPYITTGSVTAFLLQNKLITRDPSIHYLQNYNFDTCAEMLHKKIVSFENALKEKKQMEADDRDKKIQSLIEQKRKKQ